MCVSVCVCWKVLEGFKGGKGDLVVAVVGVGVGVSTTARD